VLFKEVCTAEFDVVLVEADTVCTLEMSGRGRLEGTHDSATGIAAVVDGMLAVTSEGSSDTLL